VSAPSALRAQVGATRGRAGGLLAARRQEAAMGYLFIAPLLAVFATFVLYPLALAVQFAFSRYQFLTGEPPRFTGLANFERWLADERVLETFGVALRYTLLYVPASTLYALVVAVLLDRVISRRISTGYRVLLYLPVVLPASITYHMWKWIYDPTWGLANQLLAWTGLASPQRWLSDPGLALSSIALMEVWHLMGVTMMLFLVGLNNIPRELGEAAKVDGAGEWSVFRHVTLPLLRPIFMIVLVLRLQSLGVVTQPLIMTDGGPIRATTTYGLQAYFIAFRDTVWNIGYASTWFLMLGLFSAVIAFVAWRAMRAEVE
jgi:ABC-type sugar transport system permease subunit